MEKSKKSSKKKKLLLAMSFIFVPVISFFAIAVYKYNQDINFSNPSGVTVKFTVEAGDSLTEVSSVLKQNELIPSKTSFEIYARLSKKTSIKAGKYELSSKMTIPQIADILNSGQIVKTFDVMFVPGGTVKMAKNTLVKAGFSEAEVQSALAKDYSAEFPKLFANKSKDADLEGFLYGETHTFEKETSAEDVIRRFLRDFESKIVSMNLSEKFKKRGLNLYQGITLASIVQKETLNDPQDQKMVAGVFYNRMKKGMNLGSDVTYQYIADKLGVARDYNMKNPYNLRIYTGLTPTPISTPSISSLQAVADPSEHEYLYFLSGDDDKTYFGKTEAEHQKNIVNHCQKKCQII